MGLAEHMNLGKAALPAKRILLNFIQGSKRSRFSVDLKILSFSILNTIVLILAWLSI